MVLHNVDLKWNLSFHQRLSYIIGLCGSHRIEIVFKLLLLQLLVNLACHRLMEGKVNGTPIGTVEDARGPHVEEDHCVTGAEVILNGPFYSEGAFVAKIDGNANFAFGAGRWGVAGGMQKSWR
ncbi:hypothetical protein L6164_036538 [Bauhinia variegata]|uniref:Uncharacterized protein n=1 Tax=Bauhinia variegata TaxID=167791 RepID=A0ACB9KH78_BAUVA|nr:hypothetical protein L6164_036538 [Bauhinia variegata]